jgi:hypothetical protein
MPKAFLAAAAFAALFVAYIAYEEHEYWGQPDEAFTVVAAAADGGTYRVGRLSCDGWTFRVESGSGKEGHFRGCDDRYAVGDSGTARWHPGGTGEVMPKVTSAGQYPITAGAAFLVVGLLGAIWATWITWRSRRAARPARWWRRRQDPA